MRIRQRLTGFNIFGIHFSLAHMWIMKLVDNPLHIIINVYQLYEEIILSEVKLTKKMSHAENYIN